MVGANWYILSVESQVRCWRREMNKVSNFRESYLGCGRKNENVFKLLNSTCLLVDPDSVDDTNTFNYGIFFDGLQSGVVDSTTDFPQKFFYCFWWGLRNLRLVNDILCYCLNIELHIIILSYFTVLLDKTSRQVLMWQR